MNLDDMDKLKFDRRMEQRRGWLAPGEREAHLESLPDAADKIDDGSEEEPRAAAAPAEVTPPTAAPPQPTTTPESGSSF